MTGLDRLHRDLNRMFGSAHTPPRPRGGYVFRTGPNGLPDHLAEVHGPYQTKEAAEAAREAWEAAQPKPKTRRELLDAPYAWAIEREL